LYACLPGCRDQATGEKLLAMVTPKNQRNMGLALCRAGRYSDALPRLGRATWGRAWDGYFLAIALNRLGRIREGRQALSEALEWNSIRSDKLHWQERLASRLMRAEVESMFPNATTTYPPLYLTADRRNANLLHNASFESDPLEQWGAKSWLRNDLAMQPTVEDAYAGTRGMRLQSEHPDDVIAEQAVAVKPHSRYLLCGWIKTEDVVVTQQAAVDNGATLAVWGTSETTSSLVGTNPWTYVAMVIYSGDRTELLVGPRLGHHSSLTTGTAWFDELYLIDLGPEIMVE